MAQIILITEWPVGFYVFEVVTPSAMRNYYSEKTCILSKDITKYLIGCDQSASMSYFNFFRIIGC